MISNFKTYIYISFFIQSITFHSSAKSLYTLDSVSSTGILSFSLQLPESKTNTYLKVRGEDWGLINQVEDPQCNNVPLSKNQSGHWIVPASCSIVTWTVQPKHIPVGDVDTSLQETIFIPNTKEKTILLSEPTSLLRIENEEESIITANQPTILLGASVRNNNETLKDSPIWSVPAYSNAPEFYLIGDVNTDKTEIGEINVTYYSDNVELTNHLQLKEQHRKLLSFLVQSIMPNNISQQTKSNDLLVIWIGNNEKNNFIGGAAGNRSFVANYIYGDSPTSNEKNIKTLLVTAHEQFHQLVDIMREKNASQPAWVEEGLAQYYGLKALKTLKGHDDKAVDNIFASFIAPNAPVDSTFKVLNEKFKQGDHSVYPLFYSQGATFWYQFDNLLLQETDGEYGLDDLIPLLVKSKPDVNGGLPKEFVSKVTTIGGNSVQQLLQKYVGS